MQITRSELRKLILETFNPRSPLHPKYSPSYIGDEEESIKIDDIARADRSYAEELYDMYGVEKGSLQNPHSISMERLSGISDEDLSHYISIGIEDAIASSFYANNFKAYITEWEVIHDYYMQDDVMQELAREILDTIVEFSLDDEPGNRSLRRKHLIGIARNEITKQHVMKEISDWYEYINTYGDPDI